MFNVLLALLLLLLPAAVRAEDYTYTTNNGAITITGYTGPGGAVTIPKTIDGLPVTRIENSAFYNKSSLTSVTIPDSVSSIGNSVFFGCTNLTNITLGSANSIYSSVDGVLFDKSQTVLLQCPGGKAGSYTIPNSVTTIGDTAFNQCTSLTSVTSPNSVTGIGWAAFASCTSLTSVTIGNSVTGIGSQAFSLCTSLTSVTIPNSVTTIGEYVFYFCTSLTNITIGHSVTSIGPSAFEFCTNLTNVTIGTNVTSIWYGAFNSCFSLTSVTIPDSVTSIGAAFQYCPSLTAITVSVFNSAYSSVDGVLFNKSQSTLIQCPARKSGSYTIPESVTDIGERAFFGCTSLTSVTIPNGVSDIRGFAFSGCTNLTGIYFEGSAPALHQGYFIEFAQHYEWVPTPVFEGVKGTVYYLPGTTGWSSTFGDRPTAPWSLPNPLILDFGPSFGVQTNSFGFIISWATNIPVVVEASTDLASPVWAPVVTNALTGGSAYFGDPGWTNYPARFYRLRWP